MSADISWFALSGSDLLLQQNLIFTSFNEFSKVCIRSVKDVQHICPKQDGRGGGGGVIKGGFDFFGDLWIIKSTGFMERKYKTGISAQQTIVL